MLLMKRLRALVVCLTLEMGVVAGVPMRPDKIRELMHQLNQPKVAHVLPSESDDGDDPSVEMSVIGL